jgi:hypothetical protein
MENYQRVIIALLFVLVLFGLLFFIYQTLTKEEPVPCTESDNGNDIYTKGTTNGIFGSPPKYTTNEDRCIGTARVREYFCATETHQAGETIKCPEGTACSEGICV